MTPDAVVTVTVANVAATPPVAAAWKTTFGCVKAYVPDGMVAALLEKVPSKKTVSGPVTPVAAA